MKHLKENIKLGAWLVWLFGLPLIPTAGIGLALDSWLAPFDETGVIGAFRFALFFASLIAVYFTGLWLNFKLDEYNYFRKRENDDCE